MISRGICYLLGSEESTTFSKLPVRQQTMQVKHRCITVSNHTTLHINCDADAEKHKWMLTARIEGLAFEDWVRAKLNACIIDANPPWLHGLSERARVCLLGAGFKNRRGVAQAVKEGFDIGVLPNAGRRVTEEVLQWLK